MSAAVAMAAPPADVSHEALDLTAEAIGWAPTPATAALERAKAELKSQGLLTLGGQGDEAGDSFLLGINAHNGAIEVNEESPPIPQPRALHNPCCHAPWFTHALNPTGVEPRLRAVALVRAAA